MSSDADAGIGIGNPKLGLQSPQVTALITRLRLVLCDAEHVDAYKQLLKKRGSEAQSLLDILQKLLDLSGLESSFRTSLLVAIQRISNKSELYPTCYELNDVVALDDHPVDFGGFADIFRGIFHDQKVCLKAIRLRPNRNAEATHKRALKELAKEALLWGQLSHPNVLMFYGLFRFRNRMCMVSPWMENGNISEYLSTHPTAPRLPLAADVANGLSYLHDCDIIHGDLKGKNVLVDSAGRGHLADFGIASASDSEIVAWTTQTAHAGEGGTTPYQAPELFYVEEDEKNGGMVHRNTMATDVYAWACVCFEIFVGKPPFHKVNPAVLPFRISQGHRPQCPHPFDKAWTEWGLTDDIWTWIERCWHQDYRERPSAADVIQYLSFLLPIDARQEPDITPILPAHFRDRMSQGLKANDVKTLDRILRTVDLGTPTEASMIDASEAMEFTASPTNIEEGLATKITSPPSAIRFHPLLQSRGDDAEQFLHDGIKADQVILIIGSSGAGKTSFVNALFGNVGPQDHLNTHSIPYHYGTVKDQRVCIVDAPGFQDDRTVNDEILRRISQWLIKSYPAGMKTMGIVYLQDITHISMTEMMKANLHSLQKLNGFHDSSVHVVFVTTMWSQVSQKVGEPCESRLCKYWEDLLADGLIMRRFDGTQDSALAVMNTVLSQQAPEGLFQLGTTAMKAIQTFFASNHTNLRAYAAALPVSKKYRFKKTDVLPQNPSAVSQKIKIGTEDIIIAVMGRVGQERKQSFIDDALGDGYNRMDLGSHDVQFFVLHGLIDAVRNVFLIDTTSTKGQKFIDSLFTIRKWLSALCNSKRKLSGLIYLEDEDLSTTQLPHVSKRDIIFLRKYIKHQNVVVANTKSKGIDVKPLEELRHDRLIRQWQHLVDSGASVVQLASSERHFKDVFHTSWDVFRLILTKANITAIPSLAPGGHTSNKFTDQSIIVDKRSEYWHPASGFAKGLALSRLVSKLALILHSVDAYRRLLCLQPSDAQTVLDTLQKLLDLSSLDAPFRRTILVATERIAVRSGLWPSSYQLENVVPEDTLVAMGPLSDIYRGSYQGQQVALKFPRQPYLLIREYLCKEIILWAQLTHPNILPFYGLFYFQHKICIISPWMDNGDVRSYLNKHPNVPRTPLITDVANGLLYLHNLGIIHGDLTSMHVLINSAGRACLTYFGHSSAVDSNIISWSSQSRELSQGGASRWKAPEVLDLAEDAEDYYADLMYKLNTAATDVYAWACVSFEIFANEVPFAHITPPLLVVKHILAGGRPQRPPDSSRSWTEWGLTHAIWSLIEKCWHQDPGNRPSAAEIVRTLLPPNNTKAPLPTSEEMLPGQFCRRVGANLIADDVETFDRVLNTAGIQFTTKGPNQISLKLQPSGRDDSDGRFIVPLTQGKGIDVQSDKLLEDPRESDIIVIIIGPIGSGKSTFINYLMGQVVAAVGDRNESTTKQIQHFIIPAHPTDQTHRIVLVDTPGFDDSYVPDHEILERISNWIGQSYNTTRKFTGIVYLHAINQPRMVGTAQRTLDLLNQLMGGSATENVVLATTKWGDHNISPETSTRREQNLVNRHWKGLTARGAKLYRFCDSQSSAWTIIQSILDPDRYGQQFLDVQPENHVRSWLRHPLWFPLAPLGFNYPMASSQFLGRTF